MTNVIRTFFKCCEHVKLKRADTNFPKYLYLKAHFIMDIKLIALGITGTLHPLKKKRSAKYPHLNNHSLSVSHFFKSPFLATTIIDWYDAGMFHMYFSLHGILKSVEI